MAKAANMQGFMQPALALPADWAAGGTMGAGGGVYGGRSKGMHVSFLGPRPSFFHIDQCVSPASTCTWVGNCHSTAVEIISCPLRVHNLPLHSEQRRLREYSTA